MGSPSVKELAFHMHRVRDDLHMYRVGEVKSSQIKPHFRPEVTDPVFLSGLSAWEFYPLNPIWLEWNVVTLTIVLLFCKILF